MQREGSNQIRIKFPNLGVEEDRIHGDLYGGIKTWRIRSLSGFYRLCLKKRRVGISSAREERQRKKIEKLKIKKKTKQTALLWAGLIPVMVGRPH